jgi:hypothetical protein
MRRLEIWEKRGRKRSWPNLRYYCGIWLDGLGKITKTLRKIVVTFEARTEPFTETPQKRYPFGQLARILG